MTYKQQVDAIAKEVASEYEDWEYVAGMFKNKTLKHTILLIDPGFTYSAGSSVLSQPSYGIKNKKVGKLLKRYGLEWKNENWTWFYDFIPPNKPDNFSLTQRFYPQRSEINPRAKPISELKPFLEGLMEEGIVLLAEKFDLSSEEAILESFTNQDFDFHSFRAESTLSASKILLGDFDFVERLYNGEIIKKDYIHMHNLQKIVDDLPNLRKEWEEHGRIVV